jgi:[ribosomal protein S5]-alanine N-acetyltransferase
MMESAVYVRFAEENDAANLTALNIRNRDHFQQYSPTWPDEFYTEEYQLDYIRR